MLYTHTDIPIVCHLVICTTYNVRESLALKSETAYFSAFFYKKNYTKRMNNFYKIKETFEKMLCLHMDFPGSPRKPYVPRTSFMAFFHSPAK